MADLTVYGLASARHVRYSLCLHLGYAGELRMTLFTQPCPVRCARMGFALLACCA